MFYSAQDEALTARQKQLLYECEEERMVVKACLRELIKLRKSAKHTSWDTAEAANMSLSWTNPDDEDNLCSRNFFTEAAWRTDKGKQITPN